MLFHFWLKYSSKLAWKRCTKDVIFVPFDLISLVHDGNGVQISEHVGTLTDPSVWMNRPNKSTAIQECTEKQFQERTITSVLRKELSGVRCLPETQKL